jgi:hypothetical protein
LLVESEPTTNGGPMANTSARQEDEYVTYAPPETKCVDCRGKFEPSEVARRSTDDKGQPVYRHFDGCGT